MTAATVERRLRRTWPQRLLLTCNVFLIIACLVAASGLDYVERQASQVQRVGLGHVLSAAAEPSVAEPDAPLNVLIVGVDSAEHLDADDPVRSGRSGVGLLSDTIMVLRVEPATGSAALLSVPRDLWVPIAGMPRRQRINTALSTGGADVVIQTIKTYFNIEINHYIQLDFAGFKDVVEAIDGVPIYFDRPARDLRSGLTVDQAGCAILDSTQALAYARSRAFQYFEDGRWHVDGTGDLGRITRQQDFMKQALDRALSRGLRNPLTLHDLVGAGLASVTVDERLTPGDVARLVRQFGSFEPDELRTLTLPVTPVTKTGLAVLELREDEAQSVLNVFRGIDGDRIVPAIVRVGVRPGAGGLSQRDEVVQALRSAEFDVVASASSPAVDAGPGDRAETVLRFGPPQRQAAALLASWLDGPVIEVEDDAVVSGRIELIPGAEPIRLSDPRDRDRAEPALEVNPLELAGALDGDRPSRAPDALPATKPAADPASPARSPATSASSTTAVAPTPVFDTPVGELPGDEEERRSCGS